MWKGVAFPFKAGDQGIWKGATDAELIEGNILQLLGTVKGERVMLPTFGSNLGRFIHDPVDEATAHLIRVEMIDAIREWEPRVVLKEARVRLEPENQRVIAELRYLLKTTGETRDFAVAVDRGKGVYQWV